MKLKHLKNYLHNAKSRSIRENVPFDLTLQDLIEIATDECPIFHTPFVWGASGLGKGKTRPDSPTLDRILPELGYIKSNVAFLSYRANRIKDNGTMQEHYDIADWIWNHIHAKENTTTPVSTGSDREGEDHALDGFVLATGAGQNDDDTHHHCGTISGEDLDHRAQTSSRDSVGRGSKEVGASTALDGGQVYGDTNPALERALQFNRYINNQLRERGLVDGAEPQVGQSCN